VLSPDWVTTTYNNQNNPASFFTPVTGLTNSGGTVPAVGISPTSLTFASQVVNTTSSAQGVTLTNNGPGALTITSIGITGTNAGDYAQTNTCPLSPATLAVAGTCTISVTFKPTASGSRTASVSITDNGTGSPQAVSLSGTGAVPTVSLSPATLSFGNQTVNTTSAAQGTTLTNNGPGALTITSVGITGTNAGDYAQTNNCPLSPATLAVAGTCTISVTFKPTASGSRTASVSIADNGTGSPQTMSLSGTGAVPAVGLSPATLSFGNQTVNTTSAAQGVTLTNNGPGVLTITSIGITGTNAGDYAQTNNCPMSPATLALAGTCTISVTFKPTASGSRVAAVSIADNGTSSPQTVNLSGTGAVPAMGLSPVTLGFGSQTVNTTSAAQGVTLTNNGPGALTITSIGITGTNAGDYAQANTCPLSPATLAVAGTCTISVTFKPTAS
jgi:trimeric autotransporter adhesin